MSKRIPALAAAVAALLLAALPGSAAEPERARHQTCTGIYTGSARGVFWCKVVAAHDPKTLRSTLRIETDDDIQLTGDALQVVPGGFEWKGAPAVGVLKSGEPAVTSAWSWLQTGQPPNQVDYAAAHAAPKYPVAQGQVRLELSGVAPGAAGALVVHGTFSALLRPMPGSKGYGEVEVTVTF
jgi:hypothetical protein